MHLNNDGVIEQDYFSNSNEWVNIISVQRLKKNFKNEEIDKELEVRIKKIHNQFIKYSQQKLRIDVPKFAQEDLLKYQLEYFTKIFSLLKCFSKNKFLKRVKKNIFGLSKN